MSTQSIRPSTTELETFVLSALTTSPMAAELQQTTLNGPAADIHFPAKLWRNLAAHGFLHRFLTSICTADTPTNHLYCEDIAIAGFTMTRHHQSLGLTMTWVGQLLMCHILNFRVGNGFLFSWKYWAGRPGFEFYLVRR